MDDIFDHLITYYQPIFSLKKKEIIGYEALSRFKINQKIISFPEFLYCHCDNISLADLDWICRKKAILNFPVSDKLLFINISADCIAKSNKFKLGLTEKYLKEKAMSCSHVVLEITEAEKIRDIFSLLEILEYYKKKGFNLALDDFGTGYNTINMLLDLAEYIDYIKLPIQIVQSISKSFVKYELVKTFREIAHSLGIKVVCEGVENKDDLKTLFELGIDYVQGFYLEKPFPFYQFSEINFYSIKDKVVDSCPCSFNLLDSIKTWLSPLKSLSLLPTDKIGDLLKIIDKNFANDRFLLLRIGGSEYILNLWEFLRVRGDFIKFNLIWLRDVDWLLNNSSQISKNLIVKVADLSEVIDICELTSVLEIALLFERKNIDCLFIKDKGILAYYLLKENVFEKLYKEVYKSRIHVNPLTGLPANLVIEQTIDKLLSKNSPFFVGYLDIDNFKSFNDAYGFIAGDNLIKRTAFFLNRTLQETYHHDAFVGHIGGDDFVFIVKTTDEITLKYTLLKLLSLLEENSMIFYDSTSVKRGYFIARDRNGNLQKFPLASFSIVVVRGDNKATVHEISKAAARLKKKAKEVYGSAILFEIERKGKTTIERVYPLEKKKNWLRGADLNRRPSGYEPDELPGCSTPRQSL